MRIIEINENNAHYWHMCLWNWLAKHPSKGKENWPGWRYVRVPIFLCFACSIGVDRARKHTKTDYFPIGCEYCPVMDWKHSSAKVPCEKTYEFGKWKYSKSPKTKKKYAKIIANKEWEYLK